MVANDNAPNLTPRSALRLIASKLASTTTAAPVGASSLAMVVNDNAPNLTPRGALWLIASKLAPAKEAAIQGLLQDLSKVFIKSTAIWTRRAHLKSATPTRQPD
ncbi:Mediator of RNA polymerase II transcription subunit 33A-like [Pseudomonas sp. IT-P74]